MKKGRREMWYVVWTTTGKEEQCRVMIERKCDPNTYDRLVIPKNSIKKYVKGRWTTTETKLFPSYLFVKSEEIEAFAEELLPLHEFSRGKVVRIIQGYIGVVNKMVWRKF
jgi:transcription antitermination factor NusG